MILALQIVIEEFAKKVIAGIRENIKGKNVTPYGAMHTTGSAEDSLFYRIVGNRLIIGSTWSYITVLEDGRKPGKFAPPEVILKWVQDKPVTSNIPERSLAYLINKKLKEKGSIIYQQGGHSGILSDYLNLNYIQENLTPAIAAATIKTVTELLFKPGTTIQLQ